MVFEKLIVIDGKNHLAGRLAAIVAKELLLGQKIVVTRCEKINLSGSLYRNKLKFFAWLKKKHLTNPKRGPYHRRSPVGLFNRMVRGMIKYKTKRGEEALKRLQCFEGVPHQYHKTKRMVCRHAYRAVCLKPFRDFCTLGELGRVVGWVYSDAVEKQENERIKQSKMHYSLKKQRNKMMTLAKKNVVTNDKTIKKVCEELALLGLKVAVTVVIVAALVWMGGVTGSSANGL